MLLFGGFGFETAVVFLRWLFLSFLTVLGFELKLKNFAQAKIHESHFIRLSCVVLQMSEILENSWVSFFFKVQKGYHCRLWEMY